MCNLILVQSKEDSRYSPSADLNSPASSAPSGGAELAVGDEWEVVAWSTGAASSSGRTNGVRMRRRLTFVVSKVVIRMMAWYMCKYFCILFNLMSSFFNK